MICPDWDVPNRVKVYSSTRVGGVSEPPFDTLNLGTHVKDKQQHVLENRARVVKAMQAPNQPQWLNQVHGCDVAFIDCYSAQNDALEAVSYTHLTLPTTPYV